LRGAVGRAVQETVFDGSCIQPFIDHPSDDAVCDSLVEERPKVGVWNRIEILAYIKFEHPVEALGPDLLLQAVKCLVSRATRSEAIRAGQIVLFVDGLQHHRHGTLRYLVFEGRNPQRPLRSIRLGYVHSPNRRGLVATRLDPLQEVQEIGLKVRLIVRRCDAVDTGCAILAGEIVGLQHPFQIDDVVK
jgi:hypothetical protein